jgi:two-component system cell cycle sensor histidine kinase PleC
MIRARRQDSEGLLDNYCSQLNLLLERRRRERAAAAARREADLAARLAREVSSANQAMLAAQSADRAKSNFLANMSHELRTPLNAIIGFSEIIHRDDILPRERYPEYAKHIYDAGLHLLAIVDNLLDLARIEAGKVELDEKILPIADIMDESLDTVRAAARDKALAIDCRSELRDWFVRVDPTKIKQVLINLLGNAVKFTAAGGRVSLSAFLGSREDLVFSVVDTGVGIPRQDIDRVLRPFEQAENPLTRSSKGTGLGLSIARALVQMHGGELFLDSALGCGTTVRVHLPGDRLRRAEAVANA